MRAVRPDLPLILVLIAAGVALVLLPDRPGEPAAPDSTAPLPDVIEDFNAEPDPRLAECWFRLPADDSRPADPSDLDAVVEQTSERVERLRGLRFEREVDAKLLDEVAFRARLDEQLGKDLKPAQLRREGEVLAALGAIPPETDLPGLVAEGLSSQIAGFYDPVTKQLAVPTTDELEAEDLLVLAHELEHALVDQNIGLRKGAGDPTADRTLAYTAAAEGDASLLMFRYGLAYALGAFVPAQDVPGGEELGTLPDYVERNLLFPYLEGMRLACHRFLEGGNRAIDQLYAKPPASTAEVLFPERYGEGAPERVELPRRPGPGWTSVIHRELGAAELEWLLQAPGGDPEAGLPETRELVYGWAGGELELWERDEERALAIALAERPGSDRLCAAVGAWYRATRPEAAVERGTEEVELEFTEPGRAAVLSCAGNEVRLGVAPDPATASRLAM